MDWCRVVCLQSSLTPLIQPAIASTWERRAAACGFRRTPALPTHPPCDSRLTDTTAALAGARDASISIGAITVQAGGTGVILAGTGDPNDGLDSYYGAGILRSGDGGNSWELIAATS